MRRIVITSLILLNISISNADDFEKYQAAFEYITSDTVNLNNWFKEEMKYDTLPAINVSNEIVYIGY